MSLDAAEQYMLELMNRARLDPAAEAARLGISLNAGLAAGTISSEAMQVLAPNDSLQDAAEDHSHWMRVNNVFSHTGSGGSAPWDRAEDAGYDWWSCGENIAWTGTTGTLNLASSTLSMHNSLFLSAGHRANLLNPTYSEVGVGIETGPYKPGSTTYNAALTTQLFGDNGGVFVTGVAYDDANGDGFYTMGEGQDDVGFSFGSTGKLTPDAGGYVLDVSGRTSVEVTVTSGAVQGSVRLNLEAGNVKLDLVDGDHLLSSGDVTMLGGIDDLTLLGVGDLDATGSSAANSLTGNDGANQLYGKDGNDSLFGSDGNDTLRGEAGNDSLQGQTGNDRLSGSSGKDTLSGGDGNDRLNGGSSNDRISGGTGADTFEFYGDDGADTITDFSLAAGDKLKIDDALWAGSTMSKSAVVTSFAEVTSSGVLLDFGDGQSVLLQGLTTTDGLSSQIVII